MKSYQTTFSIKRLWIILSVGMVVMFGILLLLGQQIYQQAPPIPEAVKSQSGETLFTRADIETGQNIWQSIGGMEQGSISVSAAVHDRAGRAVGAINLSTLTTRFERPAAIRDLAPLVVAAAARATETLSA